MEIDYSGKGINLCLKVVFVSSLVSFYSSWSNLSDCSHTYDFNLSAYGKTTRYITQLISQDP